MPSAYGGEENKWLKRLTTRDLIKDLRSSSVQEYSGVLMPRIAEALARILEKEGE